ncbi:hypothetical protein NTG1052_570007 [Candidatus Nitrotoga sp. 1052]|nr:hypothetical protein NTG1052_570007 [Candidatus Nitrotoga sp. 1052]
MQRGVAFQIGLQHAGECNEEKPKKTVESNPLLAAKKEATRFQNNGGGWLFVY